MVETTPQRITKPSRRKLEKIQKNSTGKPSLQSLIDEAVDLLYQKHFPKEES